MCKGDRNWSLCLVTVFTIGKSCFTIVITLILTQKLKEKQRPGDTEREYFKHLSTFWVPRPEIASNEEDTEWMDVVAFLAIRS